MSAEEARRVRENRRRGGDGGPGRRRPRVRPA